MTIKTLLPAMAIALMAGAAQASTITVSTVEVQNVSLNGPANALPLQYNEFDPDKGTLNRVEILVNSVLNITASTLPQMIGTVAGPVPVSYSGPALITTTFDAIGGRGFETVTGSYAPVTFLANGAGGVASAFLTQNFSVTFDSTDPAGIPKLADPDGAGPASPFVFSGGVADFLPKDPLATGIPIFTNLMVGGTPIDPRITPITYDITGSMTIFYHYSYEVELPGGNGGDPGDPGVVPLPSGLPLLLGGLMGLAALRRRARG